jgi:MoaA/NifB/PqqE/SkfB family radical SAM enzyme
MDWVQVEVSTYCNASCIYCPRTVYHDTWLNRHMPLATFKKLLPAFAKTRLVFLQGWGEPFLNPNFFKMVSIAKDAGCRVGTTTNGMLLDDEKISRIVRSGVDVVAFSLAGTGDKNDTVRKGTRLENVLGTIRSLDRSKKGLGTTQPEIHIAYMLLRSGINDVAKLPRLLQGLGVSQVVITTLDFLPAIELADEAIIPDNEAEYNALRLRLEAVVTEGERYGLDIRYCLGLPGEQRQGCTENVQRALFISADGAVSPCVFTNLPVSEASCIVDGVKRPCRRLTFGNINQQPLTSIWRQKNYAAFRNSFYTNRLFVTCRDCPKLYKV